MVYRAVSFGLLIMTIMSATTGYKAIYELFVNQNDQILLGDITGVTEFQEYICKVYNDGLMAFAGVGDDKGYPLQDGGGIKDQATIDFYDAVAQNQGDLLYYVYDHNYVESENEYSSQLHTNFETPIFSEYDGHLLLPDNVRLLFYRSGPEQKITFSTYLNLDQFNYSYKPDERKAQDLDFVLAMKSDDILTGNGVLREMQKTADTYRDQLVFLAVSAGLLIVSWIFCLATLRTGRAAKKNMAEVSVRILFGIKAVLFAVIIIAAIPSVGHPFTYVGERDLVRVGLLGACLYPILVDLKRNAVRLWQCCIPVLIWQYIKDWGESQTWKKRLGVYAGGYRCGSVVLRDRQRGSSVQSAGFIKKYNGCRYVYYHVSGRYGAQRRSVHKTVWGILVCTGGRFTPCIQHLPPCPFHDGSYGGDR